MKFGREYEATLEHDQYPQHWIQCSISYRQLKKCIRKIQQELSELGLDAEVLRQRLAMSVNTRDENVQGFPAGLKPNIPLLAFVIELK